MLPFSAAMREREAQLRRAVVAVVVGAARTPSAAQVHDELCSEFSLSPHSFSVRRFFPEDFLVTFQSDEIFDRVARRRSIPLGQFRLLVAPWSRQLHAREGSMLFRVRLHLEGIPGHAWDEATAAAVLGSSCRIISCDPVSSSASDMAVFKLYAWTSDPASIPKEKWLRIVEDGGPVVTPQGTCERYLDYVVLIHLTAMEDHISPPEPYLPFAPSSGDSGRPSSDDSDDGPPRRHFFHTSRGRRDGSPPPPQSGQGSTGGGGGGGHRAAPVAVMPAELCSGRLLRRAGALAPEKPVRAVAGAEAAMARRRRPQKVLKWKSKFLKLSPVRSCCRWQPRKGQDTSEPVSVAKAKESSALQSLSLGSVVGQEDREFVLPVSAASEADSAVSSRRDMVCQSPLPPDASWECCWRTDWRTDCPVPETHDPMLEEASGFPGSVHSTTQVGLAASPVGLEAQQGGLVLSTVAGPAVESAGSRPEVQSQPSPLAMEEAHHDASTFLQGSVSAHADPFLSVVLAAKPSMAMAAPGESALPPPDSVPDATLGVEAVSAPLVCPEQHLAASSTPLSQVFSPVSALPTASAVVEVAEIGGPFPDEVVPVDEMAASPPAPSTAVFAAAVEEASAPPPTLITFSRRAKKAIPPALLPRRNQRRCRRRVAVCVKRFKRHMAPQLSPAASQC